MRILIYNVNKRKLRGNVKRLNKKIKSVLFTQQNSGKAGEDGLFYVNYQSTINSV